MHYKAYKLCLFASALAATANGQSPPPSGSVKPVPLQQPNPSAQGGQLPPSTPSTLDRFQDCFDKLVDKQSTDQKFMRNCLGLTPHKRSDGRFEYLTREELKSGDDKRTEDVRACYKNTLMATKNLNIYPQGILDIFLRIDKEGAVKVFRIGKKSIQDSAVLTCIDRIAKTWTFPQTTVVKTIPIRYQWILNADKDRKPKVMLADGYPKISKPPGLTPAEIIPVIQASSDSIRNCYEVLLRTEPSAQGRIIVEMLVGKQGQVRRSKIIHSELPQPSIQECIIAQTSRLRFTAPRGGKPFAVRYPFLLTQMP